MRPLAPIGQHGESEAQGMEGLVHRARYEPRDAIEVEHGGHGAGQPLERALEIEALTEEEAVDHALSARVERVEEEHYGEAEDHCGGERARAHAEAGEDDVEEGNGGHVRGDDHAGDHDIDAAEPDHRAHVEELVAHHGVGHGEGEDEVELPEEREIGHRHARHRL